MSTAGPNSPGTGADSTENGSSGASWTNPSNALADDANYATIVQGGTTSHLLLVTNFGFAIPTATLNGIVVEVKAKCSSGTITATATQIRKSASNYMTSAASFTVTTTEGYISMGSSSSTSAWGSFPPTITQINSFDFGVGVQLGGDVGTPTLSVNHVRVTITYTAASGYTNLPLMGVGLINTLIHGLTLGLCSWRWRPFTRTQTRTAGVMA